METCQRKKSDRRGDERRITHMAIEIDRRTAQRRLGFDRRDMVSGQVS